MSKLYFKYGVMGSCKTALALTAKYNYEQQGMRVCMLKPGTDTRDGEKIVKSRIGLAAEADLVIQPLDHIPERMIEKGMRDCDALIVDEAQFFTEQQVDELRYIADVWHVPVLCYGLRTDFRTHFFEGSRRLMEVADSIQEETKYVCKCGKKAIYNARFQNGVIVLDGAQVMLGGDESYQPLCAECYREAAESLKAKK